WHGGARGGPVRKGKKGVPAGDTEHHLVATLVGHRHCRHARFQFEQLRRDGERRRRGGIVGLVWVGLPVGNEIFDRLDQVVGRTGEDQWKRRDHGQRQKVAGWVVGQFRVYRRRDRHLAAGCHHNRVSVRRLVFDV